MSDTNLDEFCEVTDLNFDGDAPHIAITGRWQGYSANGRTKELLLKSSEDGVVPQEIIKSLDGQVPEQVLVKMSYSNMRRSLEQALTALLKEMEDEDDYVWVDVYDFNDDMVAFRYREQLWAVDYEATEDGVVTIGQDLRVTSNRELYVDSETGEELIKASFWRKDENPEVEDTSELEDTDTDGEIEGEDPIDTPEVEDKEDNMSEKIEMTPEQLQEEIQKALVADRAHQEELRKAQELKASTTELVKGLGFVEEGDVEELVKSLVAEGGEVLVKAFSAAKEKVDALQVELEKAAEQPEEVVVEDVQPEELEKGKEPVQVSGEDRTAQLADIVKAKLAAKNK